ncbi:MAG: hypothetical protein IJV06_03125 [Bacteroidaceae bacterium]|nr:hypothetical protein [Bacteroidaceae bacterium]
MYVSTTKDGYQEKQIGGQVAKMTFIEQDIDVNALYDLLINGHSIQCCYGIEGEYHPLKGRGVKKDRFKQTNIVSVDLDDIPYSWIELKAIMSSVLPTMMYTTYNHIIEGNRYRLLYCFDEPIYSFELYDALYKAITSRLGIEVTDNCGRLAYQMMHGTNKAGEHFNSKNYNKVFSFSSFLSPDQVNSISNVKGCNKVALCTNIVREKNNTNVVSKFVQEATPIDESLIRDANKLSYEVFWHHYRKKYRYIYRKEKSDWIDYKYQLIDNDYIRCDYRVKKLIDGEGRKNWLFKQALVRRCICPDIDIDTLFYSMVIDFYRFIDNSNNTITIADLIRQTTNAYTANIYEDSETIKKAKAKAPKSGIILRQGTYKNVGDYMHQISLIKEQYGVKRCRMTLYNERKKAGEVVARNNDKDYAEIYDKIDVTLSRNANLKALKDMGYKIGKNKVSELLSKKLSKENNTLDQVN